MREWARCWFEASGEDSKLSCAIPAANDSQIRVGGTVDGESVNGGVFDPAPFEQIRLDDEANLGTTVVKTVAKASFPIQLSVAGFAAFVPAGKLALVDSVTLPMSTPSEVVINDPTTFDAGHPIVFASAIPTVFETVFHYADNASISGDSSYYDALRAAGYVFAIGGDGGDGNRPKEGEKALLLAPPGGAPINLVFVGGGASRIIPVAGAGTYLVNRQGVTKQ